MAKAKRLAAVGGAAKVLRTTFDGLPIVDAKADFSLLVRTSDIIEARNAGGEFDPGNCALAKACANHLGSSQVLFFRSVAYLDLPDESGKRRVVRYMLSREASDIVRAFDGGRSIKGEVVVTLKAPAKYKTLDAILEKGRKTADKRNERRRKARKALLRGELDEGVAGGSVGIFKRPRRSDMDVRSGSGMIHNTLKKAAV